MLRLITKPQAELQLINKYTYLETHAKKSDVTLFGLQL